MKSARRRAGLTQEQLSVAVDKAVETISNIERDTLTGLEALEHIAKALGTPLSYFFEDYSPGRRITRRRSEIVQQLLDNAERLPDEQLRVAIKIIQVLKR